MIVTRENLVNALAESKGCSRQESEALVDQIWPKSQLSGKPFMDKKAIARRRKYIDTKGH